MKRIGTHLRTIVAVAVVGMLAVVTIPQPKPLQAAGSAPVTVVNTPLPDPLPGQWVSIGPRRVTAPDLGSGTYDAVGRLTTIAINPVNPQIIYVGAPGELGHEGCGVWKTTDGGKTWQPMTDSLPTLAVAAIAIDPTNPDRVYIATARDGVFLSDDAGVTWVNVGGSNLPQVVSNTRDGDRAVLLINPSDPRIMYMTTEDGVLRSTDAGAHWESSLLGQSATALVMDPLNPTTLYAAIRNVNALYKTTDGGADPLTSWVPQTQSPLPSLLTAQGTVLLGLSHPASDPHETVYVLFPEEMSTGLGFVLFRTNDADVNSWSSVSSCTPPPGPQPNECFRFNVLGVDPVDQDRVYLGGAILLAAQIGVTPFVRVPLVGNDRQPASPHGDYWELAFDATNPQILYAGSDGGIFRSSDHGMEGTWTSIGEGITNVEMYDIAQAATQPGRLIAGTQDNGNIRYSGSPIWDHIPPQAQLGGDGSAVAIDATNPNILYAMGQLQDSLGQSLDGGQTPFLAFAQGLPLSPNNNGTTRCAMFDSTFHFQVHPTVPTTLLASCNSLLRTTTNVSPGNWTSIFPPPTGGGRLVRSAIDALDDLYYAGTDRGGLFAGPSGACCQAVFTHPPFPSASESVNVSDIEVDPAHPDTIYVSFAPPTTVDRRCFFRAGNSRIYQLKRTSPLPDLTMVATDITSNLPPGLCVNSVAIDPHIPRTVFAATNKGVYRGRSNATGGSWFWEAYNNGLPPADVRDLEVHPVTGHINAATYGRSAFEVIPETILPVAIDIKPGGFANSINPKSGGKIPVAILSSPTFDAPNEVNRNSLMFGRTGTEASLSLCNTIPEDVNGDGLLDQVCHFFTSLTAFQLGDTEGILTGLTLEGTAIQGRDSVTILK